LFQLQYLGLEGSNGFLTVFGGVSARMITLLVIWPQRGVVHVFLKLLSLRISLACLVEQLT